MLGFLRNLTTPKTKKQRDPERYARERNIAQGDNAAERLSLAQDSRTHQEILYYMAEKDPDPKVRQAIAENTSTPLHISPLLAADTDADVRMALAGRMVELLPELSQDAHSQLYAYAVQALSTLALDEVLKIRKALAETLKDHAHTPPKIAGKLARDVEQEVAEPILRFCTALGDDDLMDILRGHPAGWAVEAIAARPAVSENVSQAVIDTGNIPAGAALIRNTGAAISRTLLEHIVEKSRTCPEWQGPLAGRRNLPPEMAKALAKFVDQNVRRILLERGDFDEETTEEIATVVRRRIDFENTENGKDKTAIRRVERLAQEGRLNEETLSDALAMRDREFVIAAIAFLARIPKTETHRIFDMQAAKPICALVWKAGLSMRMALRLQQEIGHVQTKELLYPKGGTDYPMTEEELHWQLEFLGLA